MVFRPRLAGRSQGCFRVDRRTYSHLDVRVGELIRPAKLDCALICFEFCNLNAPIRQANRVIVLRRKRGNVCDRFRRTACYCFNTER